MKKNKFNNWYSGYLLYGSKGYKIRRKPRKVIKNREIIKQGYFTIFNANKFINKLEPSLKSLKIKPK